MYDLLGRLVRMLVEEEMSSGEHVISWDGLNSSGIQISSGIFFCRLSVDQEITTRKIVLLR